MDAIKIDRILHDTAYVHTGGTKEELKCAEYLIGCCKELGLEAHIEEFEVPMAEIKTAKLICDGTEIPCKGYFCSGNADITAELYYLPSDDPASLANCKGRIVMIDGYMGYWKYQDILENGAVGFITYDGNANYVDEDIDQRELRSFVHKGNRIPGVNINAKNAIKLVNSDVKTAHIILEQDEYTGHSRNVVAEIPGDTDETIVCTAHYDTTSLSTGAYDNMSGSIGLLGIAEKFVGTKMRRSLRFVWCGSEERGLLGSKAYVAQHEDELKNIVLDVNLDMIGCIMGGFIACCTCEERMVHYIEYLASIAGFGIKAKQDVYSSDSTPFADKGVPSLSFARIAPNNTATIHNSYDTLKVMKPEQCAEDIDFINRFVSDMVNAMHFPAEREIPENVKEKLDIYLMRKRDKK